MSNTLINSVRSVFTDTLISKFAALLNEAQGNIQKAVQAAVPIVLTEILHQAGTPEGAAKIGNLSKQAAGNDFFGQIHEFGDGAGSLVAGSVLLKRGSDFAGSLLGERIDIVIKEISRYSGASISSASFITGVASNAALDSVGRQMAANPNWDAKGLVLWLDTQRESINGAIPTGLEVKRPLGIHRYPREKAVRTRRSRVLTVVLGAIVVLVALYFEFRPNKYPDPVSSVNPADTLATAQTRVVSLRDTGHSAIIRVTLPNGKVLDVPKGGTEDQLVIFLSDPQAKLHKKRGDWFDFTQIGFASNSASLLLESEMQLKNIAAILTSFPNARIKIGGYSDNTGDSAENVRLSQKRADNVLAKLVDLDARRSQLVGAEGYGPNYPVGDNATAAGRNMNRRMSIDVKGK